MVSGIVYRDDRQNITNTGEVIGPSGGINLFVEEGHGYLNEQISSSAMLRIGK